MVKRCILLYCYWIMIGIQACAFFPTQSSRRLSFGMPSTCQERTVIVQNADTWEQYLDLVQGIMGQALVMKKKKRNLFQKQDLLAVQEYLVSDQCVIPLPPTVPKTPNDVKLQKQLFLNATNFSSEQYEYLSRCIHYLFDVCAKQQNPAPAKVAWTKMQEIGMLPRENLVSTYMYVLSLSEEYRDDCFQVASFHDRFFEPNEKTITLRIKTLVETNNAAAAEDVLASLPDKGKCAQWKRLRTFQPILGYYCEQGNAAAVLRLFHQMRQSDGVLLDAETYAAIIGVLARQGCFRVDAEPIESAVTLGFSAPSGPALFDEIASALAQDLLELTEAAASLIVRSFTADTLKTIIDNNMKSEDSAQSCSKMRDASHVGRITIDDASGVCPETGVKLRLLTLTESQRRQVHDTLLDMASASHEEYHGKARSDGRESKAPGSFALEQLSSFSRWLQERNDERAFSAFIDGANVAYFGHSDIHYSQVVKVVEELKRIGETPLVIMPERYVAPKFWLASTGQFQQLSEVEIDSMNRLRDEGRMYTVATSCLDDYYWMLASVANQTVANVYIDPDNEDGRFPGVRPMLITNDQMRDHKLSLLEPRLFRRWSSCHIVNYDIQPYEEDEWEDRKVIFRPPDFFSREIQANSHPRRPSRTVWHFPVMEWPDPERLCIYLAE